MLTAQFIAT